jgi:prepilin-type N-terminal cleavage/methylation domain-containing protein
MISQKGFTLIELLTAIAAAAILSLLIATSYQAVMVGGLRGEAEITGQQSARIALNLLTDDARSTGFVFAGAVGLNRCNRVLAYRNGAAVSISPVLETDQTASGFVPETTIPFGYAGQGAIPTNALTLSFNNSFGDQNLLGSASASIAQVNGGQGVSLSVNDASTFTMGHADILALPTLGVCALMQITQISGNTLVHDPSLSAINPPNGLGTYTALLPRAITSQDVSIGLIEDAGGTSAMDGLNTVTYSIRLFNGTPTLYRTVVNGYGVVSEDSGIISNAVYIRTLFAPLVNGVLGGFKDWASVVAANQQASVGAIQFAVVVQKKNVGNRAAPVSIPVLDTAYPAAGGYEYSVYSRTIFLKNIAWD